MTPALITDGSIVQHEGHAYKVRLHTTLPDWSARVQVEVTVTALDDDGSDLGYFDDGHADDYPEAIEDRTWTLIFDLAAKCWPEHERIERERAEVRLQRIVGSHIDFSYEDFDLRR
jgi:hypothetical protein